MYARTCMRTRTCVCVCLHACVHVSRFDCTGSCSVLSSSAPMRRNRERTGGEYPNIRHPRDLCTPLFGAVQGCKHSAHESETLPPFEILPPSPPAAAVFNCQQRGDSYALCGTSARLLTPFNPPLSLYLSPRLDP